MKDDGSSRSSVFFDRYCSAMAPVRIFRYTTGERDTRRRPWLLECLADNIISICQAGRWFPCGPVPPPDNQSLS
jgi:hypothetical protein